MSSTTAGRGSPSPMCKFSNRRIWYREALQAAIEARLTPVEPITAAPVLANGKVVDLMAALREVGFVLSPHAGGS